MWNPTYSQEAPLRSIADRLRPGLADARGVWLTVFLDDLNDPALAQAVLEDRWDRLGIDLVISSQTATAEWLRTSFAAPHMIDVPEFTTPELIAHLELDGVDHSKVQDDVFALLHKPVLASLYVRLPTGSSVSVSRTPPCPDRVDGGVGVDGGFARDGGGWRDVLRRA